MSKETQPIQAPFTIRAHHLYSYAELLRHPNPRDQAKEAIIAILENGLKVPGPASDDFDEWAGVKYVEDVLGTTPQQTVAFEDVQVKAFEGFLNLPDNFSVEITREKDIICNGCAVGNHCQPIFDGDIEDLIKFARSMRKVIGKRIKDPTKISTTLGVVKAVLLSPDWNPEPSKIS
ncbi:MAG TPA: hypothetical protein VFA93_00095 [Patescibacteria group bacterium]|nr:hypothetical protein [Patescibacteria group bacterium]